MENALLQLKPPQKIYVHFEWVRAMARADWTQKQKVRFINPQKLKTIKNFNVLENCKILFFGQILSFYHYFYLL